MNTNAKQSGGKRLLSAFLALVLILGCAGAIALWQPGKAMAEPNANGTFVKVELKTDEANGGVYSTNDIPQKCINNKMDIRLEIYDNEPENGTRTITFAKQKNAIVTAVGGTNYTNYVQNISGNVIGSETVTITLKNTQSKYFDLYFSQTYYAPIWTETITVSPQFKVAGTVKAEGNTIQVTTNCTTNVYTGVRLNSESSFPVKNTSKEVFEAALPSSLEPASQAKIGATYVMKGYACSNIPDAIFGVAYNTMANGMIPTESKQQITLPAEADLAAYDSSLWDVAVVDGRTVLTTKTLQSCGDANNYTRTGYQPGGYAFSVVYNRIPDGGKAYFEYESRLWGKFPNGDTFDVANSSSKHYYTTTAPIARLDGNALFTADTAGPTYFGAAGGGSFTNSGLYLAIGDVNNHRFYVKNAGEIDLANVVCDIPFEGDIWDVKDFMVMTSSLPTPLSQSFEKMIITYSDGQKKTVQFNDAGYFDQSKLSGWSSASAYCATNMADWFRDGKPDTVYVTDVRVVIASLPVGTDVYFGLNTTLRETARSSGSPVVPGTNTTVKMDATAVWKTDTNKSVSKSASTTKDISSADTKQIGSLSINQSQTGFGASHTAGQTVTLTVVDSYQYCYSYRGLTEDPVITVAVPAGYIVDASSVTMLVGSGDRTSAAGTPTMQYKDVDSSRIEYVGMTHNSDNDVDLYQFRYKGDLGYRDDWYLQTSLKIQIPTNAKAGKATVQTFLTEKNNVQKGATADIYGLSNPSLGALTSASSTFTVNRLSSTMINASANGDVEASTTWKQDGVGTSAQAAVNLARVQDRGVFRYETANGTEFTLAGKSYILLPSGDFTPELTGIAIKATHVDTGAVTEINNLITAYYTTSADAQNAAHDEWATFDMSDPAEAAEATAIKFEYTELPANSIIDFDLSYDIPDEATHNMIVRGQGISDFSLLNGVQYSGATNYAGFRVVKPTVAVNYYKDSVADENKYTDATLAGSVKSGDANAQLTIAAGSAAGQLSYGLPTGYQEPEQQGAKPYVVQDYLPGADNPNAINLLTTPYSDVSVKVEYYKGSDIDSATKLGDSTITGKTGGDEITLEEGAVGTDNTLNYMKPIGYQDGVQVGGSPYIVTGIDDVIKVLYQPITDVSVNVEYYKGVDMDAAELIDTVTLTGKTGGDEITIASGTGEGALNYRLPTGYRDGVQQGAVPYVVTGSDDVIKILYVPYTNVDVTVEYYKDSTSAANKLGETTLGSLTGGTGIILETGAVGTANTLNYLKPVGYGAGAQQGTVPYIVTGSTDVIQVLYTQVTDVSVTVEYYKGTTLDSATKIGDSSITGASGGDQITLQTGTKDEANTLDYLLPTGCASGVQQGDVPYEVTGDGDVIKVLYVPFTNCKVTIEYYRGTVASENYLDSNTLTGLTGGDEITLDATQLAAHKPASGFEDGEQQGSIPYTVTGYSDVIQVVYPAIDYKTATVEYFWRVGGELKSLYSYSLYDLVVGDQITAADFDIDACKPGEGYASGIVTSALPLTVDADVSKNVVTIVYEPLATCSYQIEYRLGSNAGDVLGTDTVTGATYGSKVTLDKATRNKHLPAEGYADGIQEITPYTVGLTGTIVVYYPAKTDNRVQFHYLTEDLAAGQYSEAGVYTANGFATDTEIVVSDQLRNLYKPAFGFGEGVVRGDSDAVAVAGTSHVYITYDRARNLTGTITYYRNDSASPIGTVTYSNLAYGATFSVTPGSGEGQLDYMRPAGFKAGTASPASVTVGSGSNSLNVYYIKGNTPPHIMITNNPLYYTLGSAPSLIEVLQAAGTQAWDTEDGTYSLSQIQVTGWDNVDWATVNYPGVPYTLRLQVTDSEGLNSGIETVAIFVTQQGGTPPAITTGEGGGTTTNTTINNVRPAGITNTTVYNTYVSPIVDRVQDIVGGTVAALSSPNRAAIPDDGTPLAQDNDEPFCWVHYIMAVGMVVTAAYALGVVLRRRKFTTALKAMEARSAQAEEERDSLDAILRGLGNPV